jgi:dTDP-4-dehydrorhamnose 3,5-epimerase
MPFKFERLSILDVILIEPTVHKDERGFFMETYKFSEFATFGINERFVQDNYSKSVQAVLRGLHYQKNPKAQGKLVQVLQGEILDVAVDIRKGSPTYSRWVSVTLSDENKKLLYIPAGFTHGFCVISKTAEVLYKVTEEYSPKEDVGVAWNDPEIGIQWPIKNPILSRKDSKYPSLKDIDTGFVYISNQARIR